MHDIWNFSDGLEASKSDVHSKPGEVDYIDVVAETTLQNVTKHIRNGIQHKDIVLGAFLDIGWGLSIEHHLIR
jgi:hypothetical protein